MKRTYLRLLAGVLFLGLVLTGLTLPSLWKNKVIDLLNDKYPGYSLKLERAGGHPFTSIKLINIEIALPNTDKVVVDQAVIDINLLTTLTKNVSLKKIKLNGVNFYRNFSKNNFETHTLEGKQSVILGKLPDIDIDKIIIHSSKVGLSNEIEVSILEFVGSLSSVKGVASFNLDKIVAHLNENDITATGGKLDILSDQARLKGLSGALNGMPFNVDMKIPYSKDFSTNIELNVSEIDSVLYGISHPFRSGALSLNIEKNNYSGTIEVSSPHITGLSGDFVISRQKDFIKVERLNINQGASIMNLEGVYEGSKRLAGRIRINNLDIQPWVDFTRSTNIDGLIMFESELKGNIFDNTMLTVELMESNFSSEGIVAMSGTVVYKDSIISITDPLIMEFGSSLAITEGMVNFAEDIIDLGFDLTRADVEILNRFIEDPIDNGIFTGQLKVNGNIRTPDLEMSLYGEDVKYQGFELESAEIQSNLSTVRGKQLGNIKLDLGRGSFREYGFNQGSGDIIIDTSRVLFKNIYFNRENDYVQMDAEFNNEGQLDISRVQLAYAGHYLVNTGPISIIFEEAGKFRTKLFAIHINDGTMEGELSYDNQLLGHLKLANVNASVFHLLIKDEKYRIYGNIFGELQTFSMDSVQNFTLEASIKNGSISKWNFDDLLISSTYRNGILNIDDVVMTSGEKIGFELSGLIPIDTSFARTDRLSIQSSFRNFDLNMISYLLIPDFFHLGGITSGKLNVSGTTKKTILEFDLAAENAEFDILDLGLFKAKGDYDGQRLNLTEISSITSRNNIAGSGFVPFNFNVMTEGFAKFYNSEPIYLDLKGETDNFDFLTTYIEDVDSIPGQYDIHLVLRGTMEQLIRDGSVSIKNANIYTTLLDDPITSVNASGTLQNNILTINKFTGFLTDPRKQKQSGKTTISGKIDLTRFFEPKYDLKIKGKETYFRTLTGDLEGTVDLDLAMTGRDTISISGNIPIQDVKMYQEFSSNTVDEMNNPDAKIKMDYKLNFPIDGEFRLINSQVDARMTGEISMTQFGSSEALYTGELFIVSGKFYYYGDIFNISDGYIALDNSGFNPYLDIHANTTIEDEEIYINLLGEMNNPQLILSSASGFSQSDILELLTWRKRFEDQELSSSGFGSQATALVGVWFENQLEKNLLEMTGLKDMGLVEDVSISGTSTLLNPQSDKDVSIKAELTNKVALNYAYKRSFSLGNPENSMLGVELKLNKYVSLVANVDKTGNLHVKYRLRYSY